MRRKGLSLLLTQLWQSQARISLDVSQQALGTYENINPLSVEKTGASWVAAILTAIRTARMRSRNNAMTFYRLYRAIETGETFALPDQIATQVSLRQLREEWASVASLAPARFSDDEDLITVKPFQWPSMNDDLLDRQAVVSLAGTGPVRVQQLVTEAKGRLDDPNFLASLESAGRNAANVAGREAIRPGRNLVDQASKKDSAVLGWARVTDGNPCAFCAMLASRGAIYKSKIKAATTRNYDFPDDDPESLKKYHPGCHCQVVPVFSQSDFLTPESRRFAEEWSDVTRNLSGADARAAWRKHITAQQRRKSRETNARLLQSAQEATGNVNSR